MSKEKETDVEMVQVGQRGDWEVYSFTDSPSEYANSIISEYGNDSIDRYPLPTKVINTRKVKATDKKSYEIVCWGERNDYPQMILEDTSRNMVAMQCQSFNTMCCYGQGIRFVDRDTMMDTKNPDIRNFCMRTALHDHFYRMCSDMKMFYWTVVLLTLSRDQKTIVKVRALDVQYCRITKDMRHIIFGDWTNETVTEFTAYRALDVYDPLGDLEVRLGIAPEASTGKRRDNKEKCYQYAMICRMPTPQFCYYPTAPWHSMYLDAWHDIYRLIGIGKRQMIKNTSAPRIQIEVHRDYWNYHCDEKGIYKPEERIEEIQKAKQKLKDFVCGVENCGKALITGYYIDPNGKEQRMVRIVNLNDGKKEGGDWSEDMAEAANSICFSMGVHPNLVGATPGKSQMNNSGSDKRELFTLKQATEKAFHDVMAMPFHLTAHFNKWNNITVDVPMIVLTTLDEHRDAKKVNVSNTNQDGNQD